MTPTPAVFTLCLLLCTSAQAAEPVAATASVQPQRPWTAQLRPRHALVKLADYRSEGLARGIRKAWLQMEWSY